MPYAPQTLPAPVAAPRAAARPGPRLIDLSVVTGPTPSEATPVAIDVLDHRAGAAVLGRGRLGPDDFPGGMAISNETVTLTTHTGTHMDAPLHYGPESGGAPAKSIDQVPLEWCYGPGVRLDLRHVPPGEAITPGQLAAALDVIGHELTPGDITLLWTGADRLWGSPDYLTTYAGLSGEGTAYLVERGVRTIGIDAWGLDRPMHAMIEEYERTGDRGALWPAHVYGREHEYLQLEKLAHLERLPAPTGFTLACFPVAVGGAGAGWTRVVAIAPQDADA
ncbi:cyclase family protein [Streptomyces sp. LHD-70]|uniref:cyclase family protein n=1 Tax=Streptomyces sp. LHD-70 TaxID=3072140 RepID=UPI00280EAA3C|nr:cyclase family protein [Streptomyces sp. LHD-70]MDQ8705984.1 cyclase family protein [Streptomyces sp. LHD-70]